MAASVARGSRFQSEVTAENVEFREQGSRRIHQGAALRLQAEQVAFETDFAVAPGAALRLRVHTDASDAHPLEAEMSVSRVDARPDGRFLVTGRLRRPR